MKQLTKLIIIINFLACSNTFATEPVDGFYFGVLGEISYPSKPSFSGSFQQFLFTQNPITMEPVGGGAGLALGYKIQNFRLEGELLYNVNSYRNIKIGACTLVSPNVLGPQGGLACLNSDLGGYLTELGLGFKGGTSDYYGMFNAYYDFQFGLPEKNLVPYVGIGLGYSIIQNRAQFETNKYSSNPFPISFKLNNNNNSAALQGIVGLYYYMDDFATIGMDYRYLTTLSFNKNDNTLSSNASNTAYGIHTLNFVVNFVLGKGDEK